MYEYFLILISLILSLIIAVLLFFIVFVLQTNSNQLEKISAYECGFHPFEDTRQRFNIRFYLVAILFIIFDLEIIYLFPWVLVLNYIGFFGFWVMIIFIYILTIGFIYEWMKGALDWE